MKIFIRCVETQLVKAPYDRHVISVVVFNGGYIMGVFVKGGILITAPTSAHTTLVRSRDVRIADESACRIFRIHGRTADLS